MPLHERLEINQLRIGIWAIQENLEAISKLIAPSDQDAEIRHPARTIQWLACRAALSEILEDANASIYKDDFGKPHLYSDEHISLSHTRKYAAAIVSDKLVGIDIEEITPRIERISVRFLHPAERLFLRQKDQLIQLYLIWCAKEAMYKLYGKRSIDFSENIRVHPFQIADKGTFQVEFLKDGSKVYNANYRMFDNHILVWVEDE